MRLIRLFGSPRDQRLLMPFYWAFGRMRAEEFTRSLQVLGVRATPSGRLRREIIRHPWLNLRSLRFGKSFTAGCVIGMGTSVATLPLAPLAGAPLSFRDLPYAAVMVLSAGFTFVAVTVLRHGRFPIGWRDAAQHQHADRTAWQIIRLERVVTKHPVGHWRVEQELYHAVGVTVRCLPPARAPRRTPSPRLPRRRQRAAFRRHAARVEAHLRCELEGFGQDPARATHRIAEKLVVIAEQRVAGRHDNLLPGVDLPQAKPRLHVGGTTTNVLVALAATAGVVLVGTLDLPDAVATTVTSGVILAVLSVLIGPYSVRAKQALDNLTHTTE